MQIPSTESAMSQDHNISKWKSYGLLETDGGSSSFSFQQKKKKPIQKSNTMHNLNQRIKTQTQDNIDLKNSQSESKQRFSQRTQQSIPSRSSINKQPLDDDIQFDMFSVNPGSNILNLGQQTIPIVLQLRTKTTEELDQIGVDLFCLIDISNSMQGQKIEYVKQILHSILTNLREQDRLCLISFNNEGKLLTGLQKVTPETQEYFAFVIDDLQCIGTTQLWKGTEVAFDVINQRKNKNNWARILIFSDGQDEIALTKIRKQLEYNYDIFTIDSFGFSNSNANKRLSTITNLRFGKHYIITNEQQVFQCLEEAFANFPFNLWDDVTITISTNLQNIPFDKIMITEIHSEGWVELQNQHQYQITIPNLEIGESFLFPIELAFQKFNDNIIDKAKPVSLLKGKIEMQNSITGKRMIKNVDLDAIFLYENDSNTLDFNTYFNCKQSPLVIWVCDQQQTQFNRKSYFELICENLQLKWQLQQQRIKQLYDEEPS
ncbi:unnamed protein product [Paramecium pentaurelia]|uniref:VWFA domain-containing protein n=1 Tax=Paramecium pentaurelia TaxID=43138 RepID=A0A8S1U6E7_9CILI|nr:unnamed protein product [Paramecium pentaurelia]